MHSRINYNNSSSNNTNNKTISNFISSINININRIQLFSNKINFNNLKLIIIKPNKSILANLIKAYSNLLKNL